MDRLVLSAKHRVTPFSARAAFRLDLAKTKVSRPVYASLHPILHDGPSQLSHRSRHLPLSLPPSRDVLVDASSQVSHERREARSVVRLAHAGLGIFVGVRDELPPRKFVSDPSCCAYRRPFVLRVREHLKRGLPRPWKYAVPLETRAHAGHLGCEGRPTFLPAREREGIHRCHR